MKAIWNMYRTDWRNIGKVPTAIFLVIALVVLPCVYDWVNVISVWDPYAHTQGIKIAVTSKDEGAMVEDKPIRIGDEVLNSLQANSKLGWTFVTEEEAADGVERGRYYASIVIPADFSQKIVSITEGMPQRPEVIYTVNEKINAVAPKITGSGVSAVTAQINENFVRTVSETVLTKLGELGLKLEEELPTIRKVEQGILTLEASLPEIQAAGDKVLEVEQKLPELDAKAQKIVALEANIPQLDAAGAAILTAEARWPLVNEAAAEVLALHNKLPALQQAADRVTELDRNFEQVGGVVDRAIDDVTRLIEIVAAAQSALPKLDQIATEGGAFAAQLEAFLSGNEAAFQALLPVVKQNLIFFQSIADAAYDVTGLLQQANIDPEQALRALTFVQDRLTGATAVVGRTVDLLSRLNALLPNAPLARPIERLTALKANFTNQSQTLGLLIAAIERGEQPARELVERLHTLSGEASALLDDLIARYDGEIAPALTEGVNKLQKTARLASEALTTAKAQLPNMQAILSDAQTGLRFGQEQLALLKQELPTLGARVHETALGVQDKMNRLSGAMELAVPFIQEDLPEIGQKLGQASDYVRNELPATEAHIRQMSDFVQHRLPEVEDGVRRAADLVRNDLPGLSAAVRKAADTIRQVQGQDGLAELARLLRGDITAQSDFLAHPVQIKEQRKYPIPNYGSAMSPFYAVLSLWVGATLLISLLRVDVEDAPPGSKGYQLYFGRLLTFLTIGTLQALTLTLGDLFLLGAYVADKTWFVLFAVLVSHVFVTITYTLLSVFGNTGKGIAIIFLVLQFSSSGGTFPVSTTSAFFQALNPFVPFTYAISLLREAVGGILPETALRDVLCLCGFIALSYLLALALKKPLSGYTRRSAEKARQSKVIS